MDEEKQDIENKEEDLASQWAAMVEDQPKDTKKQDVIETEPEKNISENTKDTLSQKIGLILDIPVLITFEIGSRKLSIEDIARLSPNSIIELDRYIDQPIDIKVNGVLVAKGEIYQVDDNFAVKIVQIISKEERINLLNSQIGE